MTESHLDCKKCNETKLLQEIFGSPLVPFNVDIGVGGDVVIEGTLSVLEKDVEFFGRYGTEVVIYMETPV